MPPVAKAPQASTIFVDAVRGSDSNPGTQAEPLATIHAGVALTRTLPKPATLFLRAGTFYLGAPVQLGSQDSGLTISAYSGEPVWLSGAQLLPPLTWAPYSVRPPSSNLTRYPSENNARGCSSTDPSNATCGCSTTANYAACEARFNASLSATSFTYHDSTCGPTWSLMCCIRHDGVWRPVPQAGHFSGKGSRKGATNIWQASVSQVPSMTELRVNGIRFPRARFPNANPETDIFPVGWVSAPPDNAWHPAKPSPPIVPVDVVNAALAKRNSTENSHYSGALGGACHVFDPPFSYWCSEHPAGGGGFQYYVPGGVTVPEGALPPFTLNPASPPVMHVWRKAHWANWAFEVEDYDAASGNVTFGAGGFQGARGGPGQEYFVENALELLDVPTEWFFDQRTQTLYFSPNATAASGAPPDPSTVLEVPLLHALIIINASAAAPATNISLLGLGFKDSAPTFLSFTHSVPSGGDWALERIASVHAEGVEGLTVSGCNWTRIGGNALMLSGWARDTLISGNSFRFTGGSAMVAWGRTDEVSDSGTHGWDATDGNFPMSTRVVGNLVSEVGVWMKQNSCWVQAKAALTTLEGNVCFNVGRAGFNFNDGLGGGDQVHNNLIFNTNRESADHGP